MRPVILYRVVGAQRIKWQFVVDEADTIVSEGPFLEISASSVPSMEATKVAPADLPNPLVITPEDKAKAMLTARGVKFHEKDGKIFLDHVPEREQIISAFLNTDGCPPGIPGCEGLKSAMQSEIVAAGGDSCTACTKNKIRNKYRQILGNILPA